MGISRWFTWRYVWVHMTRRPHGELLRLGKSYHFSTKVARYSRRPACNPTWNPRGKWHLNGKIDLFDAVPLGSPESSIGEGIACDIQGLGPEARVIPRSGLWILVFHPKALQVYGATPLNSCLMVFDDAPQKRCRENNSSFFLKCSFFFFYGMFWGWVLWNPGISVFNCCFEPLSTRATA